MEALRNCWEIMRCGREPGGEKASQLGICPAALTASCDGLNRGKNGGRICWAVAGTLCEGKTQGVFAQKISTCMTCEVFRIVHQEENGQFLIVTPK
jgi:hypothetical protein